MTITLGTRFQLKGQCFEVVRIDSQGMRIRPLKPGSSTCGTQYKLGEKVRIVGYGESLTGEIISLDPVRAKIEGDSVWSGITVSPKYIRKGKPNGMRAK